MKKWRDNHTAYNTRHIPIIMTKQRGVKKQPGYHVFRRRKSPKSIHQKAGRPISRLRHKLAQKTLAHTKTKPLTRWLGLQRIRWCWNKSRTLTHEASGKSIDQLLMDHKSDCWHRHDLHDTVPYVKRCRLLQDDFDKGVQMSPNCMMKEGGKKKSFVPKSRDLLWLCKNATRVLGLTSQYIWSLTGLVWSKVLWSVMLALAPAGSIQF